LPLVLGVHELAFIGAILDAFLAAAAGAVCWALLRPRRERRALERDLVARRSELEKREREREEEAQAARRRAEEEVPNYPVPEYLAEAASSGNVNIAVVGAPGSGRSSFVNALRGVGTKDRGAAKVGVVSSAEGPQMYRLHGQHRVILRRAGRPSIPKAAEAERVGKHIEEDSLHIGDWLLLKDTSQDLDGKIAEVVAAYERSCWLVKLSDGKRRKVRRSQIKGRLADCNIWDLPGAGSKDFPQKWYLQMMGIRHFDMVILVTADRFTEAELMLLQELQSWNVPFFLVRNKVDNAIELRLEEESKEEERKREVAEETVAAIREHFETEYGLDTVYLVSSRAEWRDRLDFRKLESHIALALQCTRGVTMEQECPVCMERYADFGGDGESRQELDDCGHTLCRSCLVSVRPRGCPICRQAIVVAAGSAPPHRRAAAELRSVAAQCSGFWCLVARRLQRED